jgi:hypothetical protein
MTMPTARPREEEPEEVEDDARIARRRLLAQRLLSNGGDHAGAPR